MRLFSIIIAATAALLVVNSCRCNKLDEDFIRSEKLSLRVKGKKLHEYEPNNWQIGFNEDKKQFRIHNDTMSEYYILNCSSLPEKEGQTLRGDLKWSTSSSVASRKGVEFKVEKKDDAGNIWLWSKKSGIAVSVRRLR